MLINIDSILVSDTRARKQFLGLDELANSIKEHGLIQPIVVEELVDGDLNGHKYLLIAGERRLRAHQILKESQIDAVFRRDLDDITRLELELEENLHREDFQWQEEVALKKRIHEMKRKQAGQSGTGRSTKWTIVDTAIMLGESKSLISNDLTLADGLLQYPELAQEKSKSNAFKKLKQLEIDRLQRELAKRQLARLGDKISSNIIHGDCLVELKKLPANSVHLVVVDPPYGIDYEELATPDRSEAFELFDDDKAGTLKMIEEMLIELKRVMAPNSSMYMFFGIANLTEIKAAISKHFQIDPIPLIWHKSGGFTGRTMAPDIYACRSYETIFYCRKGSRALLKQGQSNVLSFESVPPRKKHHITQKPVALLKELILRSSTEGELVLDCCAGSGSTLVAARDLKRKYIGIEKNAHYYHTCISRLAGSVDKEVQTVVIDLDELEEEI